jgi:hypothetical protein
MAATGSNIVANRRNSLRSTGPRTAAGRAAVAKNALRHGLTGSRAILLPDERPADFMAFAVALRADLAPQGALEEVFAARVIGSAWRLRRALRVEAGIFGEHATYHGQIELGHAFVRDGTGAGSEAFARLSRYESALERGLIAALHELQRLQAVRTGREATPPVAGDARVDGGP